VESAKNAGKVAEDDTTKDAATESLMFLHFEQQVCDTNHSCAWHDSLIRVP